MESASQIDRLARALGLLGLALLAAAAGWMVPARFRSVHPRVLEVAGQGSPGLLEAVTDAVRRGQPGAARWFARAAMQVGGTETAQIESIAAGPDVARIDFDSSLAPVLKDLSWRGETNVPTVFDLVAPERSRIALREFLSSSRSPGTLAILATKNLEPRQFIRSDRPGGQPLDAMILLTGLLHEREQLSPTLSGDLRRIAAQPNSSDEMESWYLNLLVLARRLEWSALVRLLAVTPSVHDLGRFALAAKASTPDLPVLYAAAVLGRDPAGVADQLLEHGALGRSGLRTALGMGADAVRVLAADGRPVLPGSWVPGGAARWPLVSPWGALAVRCLLFTVAAISVLAGLGLLAGPVLATVRPERGWAAWGFQSVGVLVLAGLMIAAGEPVPPRIGPRPDYRIRLQMAAAAPDTSTSSNTSANRTRNSTLMDLPTLLTIGIFAFFQVTVFVVCIRKTREIIDLPEPPMVRLRLLENEDNLFDAGLYVGIAGTAAALVLQVLHLVEANLLAAYSSNLMGVITVALVKIRYVRPGKRALILEAGERLAESPPARV